MIKLRNGAEPLRLALHRERMGTGQTRLVGTVLALFGNQYVVWTIAEDPAVPGEYDSYNGDYFQRARLQYVTVKSDNEAYESALARFDERKRS